MKNLSKLPEQGMDKDKLFDYMEEQKVNDTSWRDGKTFCLVYDGGPEISEVIKTAYTMFMSENGLNPSAFPSLRKFENDIVSMCAHHLNGDKNVSGSMTSGGTESILLANKTAREWAKKNRPEITKPQIVMPITAHPAFNKAAYYFGLEVITTPVSDDYRADIKAMKNAITDQTIMLVGSAPNYPFGVIDPIEEIAKMAQEKNILCHVDCCIGGILLPLFKKLGKELPNFDFTVPGVTSISVDLHKYAYAAKGASVVLYKNKDLRQHQFFATTNWPGGMYGSPTMTGTRPGGAIAAAWAIMNYLGETGYLKLAKTIKDTTEEFTKRIKSTPGIEVATAPDMSIICLISKDLDIYQVGDEMSVRGWYMDRQQFPASLHLTIMAGHAKSIDQFFIDLNESILEVRKLTSKFSGLKTKMAKGMIKTMPKKMVSKMVEKEGDNIAKQGGEVPKKSAAMYGMMAAIDNQSDLKSLVIKIIDSFFTPKREDNSKEISP